jgi:hypothetical protein
MKFGLVMSDWKCFCGCFGLSLLILVLVMCRIWFLVIGCFFVVVGMWGYWYVDFVEYGIVDFIGCFWWLWVILLFYVLVDYDFVWEVWV